MIRICITALIVVSACVACSNQKTTDPSSAKEVQRLRKIVDAGGGDAKAGRGIFIARCGKCHAMHGTGGTVAPDLTPYLRDRENLDFVLESIVRPEAMVHEYHPTVTVETTDGGFYVGTVVSMDASKVLLATPGGDQVAIPRAKVASISDRPQSLMPDQTLAGLSDQQVRDLFAYIMSN